MSVASQAAPDRTNDLAWRHFGVCGLETGSGEATLEHGVAAENVVRQAASAFDLPYGRQMSAEVLRVALRSYQALRDAYHAWLRHEDAHSLADDPVTLARRTELNSLPDGAAHSPEGVWRAYLEHAMDAAHAALARAAVIASGQSSRPWDLAHGDDAPWEACAVELDGVTIAVAPFVYQGEEGGGSESHDFREASLVIAPQARTVALRGPA